MGCCNSGEVIEIPLSKEVIEYIRNNLEANLVKQTTLNAELNNIYKNYEGQTQINQEEVIKEYSELLINLTNTKGEKESNDIRELLKSAMKLVNNNISSFHIIIFEKLQGLKDYSNIKEIIEKNSSLKTAIKENSELLNEVFEDLKQQGITDISQLSFEKFKEVCAKHGVKMSDEELQNYYNLLKTKPREGADISANIKERLKSNDNLRYSIEKYKNNFNSLINKINKEGIDVSKLTFEEFKKLCNDCGIKLKDNELKEIYDLMKENFLGFINYISQLCNNNNKDSDGNLIQKANLINNLSSIDLRTLPVAQKLERNF